MKRFLSGNLAAFLILAAIVTGCKKQEEITVASILYTAPVVKEVTSTSVVVGGELAFQGSPLTSNGICYSATNTEPTVADTKVVVDSLANTFNGKLTGLSPATKYYARAYSVNDAGTAYGEVISFTTPTATFKIDVTASTLAGSADYGFADGTGASARFSGPEAIAFNSSTGLLQVGDIINNAIRTVSTSGNVLTLTNPDRGYVNGPLADARFYGTRGMATDAAGNTYVVDAGNNVIRKITAAGVVSTFAGSPIGSYGYADSTDPLKALFKNPRGVALDAAGNVYVADFGNNRIRKITPAGAVSTLAGDGNARYVNSNAETNTASFNGPIGVAVGADGVLYVADQNNRAIRKVDVNTGSTSTLAGGLAYPTDLTLPVAVATDAQSNVYIVDRGGRIIKYLQSSRSLVTLAGKSNTAGFINGAGADARFNTPTGITLDGAGNVYVADFTNNVVRKLAISITP